METLKKQLRARARDLVAQVAPGTMAAVKRVPELEREVKHLRGQATALQDELKVATRDCREVHKRVNALEAELQEARKLNQRIGELTDVVTEVLVPAADRDDERLHKALAGYEQASF